MDGKRARGVGIDVGKKALDAAWEGERRVERFANNPRGIAELLGRLDRARDVVIFERSGGYERRLEAALAAGDFRWSLAHPLRVKAFRTAQGLKAKTDSLDARLLRDYGRNRLDAGELRFGQVEDVALEALMARRRQLEQMLHAEQCRCETAATAAIRASLRRMIAHLEQALALIETQLRAHEAASPKLACKQQAMCARIGVGLLTARALAAALPELGRVSRKEITALGGLAPRIHQSGTIHHRRGLHPGRAEVKVILFNPARVAMRWDAEIKAFAERLRARGKPGKVILVAVMRKLLVQLNAAVREALERQTPATAAVAAAA